MNPNNQKSLRQLTVRIVSTDTQEIGTGFILSQSYLGEELYILTAKHCLFGSEFDQTPRLASISLEISVENDKMVKYQLQDGDQILYNEEDEPDVAIIIIRKERIEALMGEVPIIEAVFDRKDILGCTLGGFPREFELKECHTIICSFEMPSTTNKVELSPQNPIKTVMFEENLDSIKGMSGGPVILYHNGEIYFHAIIDEFGGWERFSGNVGVEFNQLLSKNGKTEIQSVQLEFDQDTINCIERLKTSSLEEIERRTNKNKVGEIYLDRSSLLDEAKLLLDESDVLVINGGAGAGKSVFATELLTSQYGRRNVFVLRADELLEGTLTSYLSGKGINKQLTELFDSSVLLAETVIYIDAAEHIVESQKIEALESIFSLAKQNSNVKVLLSIRSRYVDKLTSLLHSFLPENTNYFEIGPISQNEFEVVIERYNWIKTLSENPKINELLRVPFYLNHTIALERVINTSDEINKRSLIIKLWDKIVKSNNPNRQEAFQTLVIERAKAMKPFIKLRFVENASNLILAISELNRDEVVQSKEDDYGDSCYAPSHDIFQDWALIKYVNELRETIPSISDFLIELGNQLMLRRGFRLWLSDKLEQGGDITVYNDFIQAIKDDGVGLRFWDDEIILSILRSESLDEFVASYTPQILEDNAFLFKRIVKLLMIVCHPLNEIKGLDTESTFIDTELENAWTVLLNFLEINFQAINPETEWLLNLFKNWKQRPLVKIKKVVENKTINRLCKLMMINTPKSQKTSSEENLLLDTYIISSFIESKELETFIDSAIEYENNRRNRSTPHLVSEHELVNYFPDILKRLKSGQKSLELCCMYPKLVQDYNFNFWIENEEDTVRDDRYEFGRNSIESEFGLRRETEHKYFPASPYQTPVYNLLRFQPIETIEDICLLFNKSVEQYVKKKSKYRNDNIEMLKIHTPKGEKNVIASSLLWSAFRGTVQVAPFLLQSVLMALEKYLLELSSRSDDKSKRLLEKCLEAIYDKSNNIAPIAVISSVSMAHKNPIQLREFILPLFSVKEFFFWDIQRYTGDFNPLAPMGDSQIIQDERHESNQLQHRREYLEPFLIKLSLTTIMVKDIHEVIDRHYAERSVDNDTWSLMLNRMDVRKFEIIEHPTENQIEFKPKLDQVLKETVKKNEEESREANKLWDVAGWTTTVISKKDLSKSNYKIWQNAFKLISDSNGKAGMLDPKIPVAYIGIKYYLEFLNEQEQQFCVDTIRTNLQQSILKNELSEPFISDDIAIQKEPLLLGGLELLRIDSISKVEINSMIVQLVFGIDFQNGIDVKLFGEISNRLWELNPLLANSIFRAIYWMYETESGKPSGYSIPEDQIETYKLKLEKFFSSILNNEIDQIKIDDLDFEFDVDKLEFLERAYNFIPIEANLQEEQLDFIDSYHDLLQKSTLVNYERHQREPYEWDRSRLNFRIKWGKLILSQPENISTKIYDFTAKNFRELSFLSNNGFLSLIFMDDCLKSIIIEQDNREDSTAFWNIWDHIYSWQKQYFIFFTHKLLLDIEWKDSAMDWKVIDGKAGFFMKVIDEFKNANSGVIIKLVSRIGFKELGMLVIPKVALLLEKKEEIKTIRISDAELWIQRLFSFKREEIINSPETLKQIIFILDQMVNVGSSKAFHIRDVFLSYSKN